MIEFESGNPSQLHGGSDIISCVPTESFDRSRQTRTAQSVQLVIVVVMTDGHGLAERGVGGCHCVKGWAMAFHVPKSENCDQIDKVQTVRYRYKIKSLYIIRLN